MCFWSPNTGVVNGLLRRLQLASNWYSEPKIWALFWCLFSCGKNLGFNMILYYSSIISFSQDYYEAAELDGATKWQ